MTATAPNDPTVRVQVDLAQRAARATPLSGIGAGTPLDDIQPMLDEVLRTVVDLLGAHGATLMRYDGVREGLAPQASVNFDEEYLAAIAWIESGQGACGRVLRDHEPVVVVDVEHDDRCTPFKEIARAAGFRSVLSAPMLTLGGELMGTLAVYHREPHTPDERELRLVATYARQAAEMIERARLHGEARKLAVLERRRNEQLRDLAATALRLSAAQTIDEMLEIVTEAARRVIGTHQGVTSRLVNGWRDATTYVSLSDKYADYRTYDEVPKGLGVLEAVLRDNRPVRLTAADLVTHPDWRGLRDAPGHPPLPDYLAAPLVARDGSNLGLIQLSDKVDGTPFSAEDEAMLVQLAQMASAAIEHHELLERERAARAQAEKAAATLQRSMLPSALPARAGLAVAARYLAGGAGLEVGGDWYDVIELDDDRLGLVVGDVMGRGVRAAAVMGQLRTAVRAYAYEGHEPAELLTRIDRVVQALAPTQLTTCLYGVLDPAAHELVIAAAGHLPPLVIDARGGRFLELEPGLPLGVGGATFTQSRVALEPGTTVLLYTDGLVEGPDCPVEEGMARLAEVAVAACADELCDVVLCELSRDDDHDDDTALLAVSLLPDPSAPATTDGFLAMDLEPVPTSSGQARRFVRDALAGRVAAPALDTALLLVSELVTNALQHAGTSARLQLAVQDGSVRIGVLDQSFAAPRLQRATDDLESGRGLLLVDALAERWGCDPHEGGKHIWFELALDPAGRVGEAPRG